MSRRGVLSWEIAAAPRAAFAQECSLVDHADAAIMPAPYADSDSDGVPDVDDACPREAFPGSADGCDADSDGDGAGDARDERPGQPDDANDDGHLDCLEIEEDLTLTASGLAYGACVDAETGETTSYFDTPWSATTTVGAGAAPGDAYSEGDGQGCLYNYCYYNIFGPAFPLLPLLPLPSREDRPMRRLLPLSLALAAAAALYAARPAAIPAPPPAPAPSAAYEPLVEAPPASLGAEPIADLPGELASYDAQFAPRQGFSSWEDARARVQAREASAAELAARIGAGGSAGAEAALSAYRSATKSREKLALIAGLGQNESAEAVEALEAIYAEAELFRLQEEALRALGTSPAEGRNDLLLEAMWTADDERLSQIAAQALYGEPEALAALREAIYGDLPMNTRLEAVHSLGAIGTPEAQQALEERVRLYAAKEIQRSFGA